VDAGYKTGDRGATDPLIRPGIGRTSEPRPPPAGECPHKGRQRTWSAGGSSPSGPLHHSAWILAVRLNAGDQLRVGQEPGFFLADDNGGPQDDGAVGLFIDQVPAVLGTANLAEARSAASVKFQDRLEVSGGHDYHCRAIPYSGQSVSAQLGQTRLACGRMNELEFDPAAAAKLVELDNDPTRRLLSDRVNKVLDQLETDSGDVSVRRNRFTNGVWCVPVYGNGEDWWVLWEPVRKGVVHIHYLDRQPSRPA
jgi:hypothetical protein